MGEELVKLLRKAISPGKTWGDFSRKVLSTLLAASIGAYAFDQYQSLQRSHWEDLPLHTAIVKGTISKDVQKYLDRLMETDGSLRSIWVYSWPDARSLISVINSGHYVNPLPLGYFTQSDVKTVGDLVLSNCSCLNRSDRKLLACPIMAENDAWGVVVFEHEQGTERPDNYKATYGALAHKLSNIIYRS